MSKNWVQDINDMHAKFGVHDWMKNELAKDTDWQRLNKFLQFRLDFLKEELNETCNAFDNKDSEEIVDGLIDLCVVAIGTLDAFGVDAYKAWDEIHNANMAKERGIKFGNPKLAELNKTRKHEARIYAYEHSELIKNLRNDGKTYRQICELLNSSEIKTRTGKSFHPVQVHRILKRASEVHECEVAV